MELGMIGVLLLMLFSVSTAQPAPESALSTAPSDASGPIPDAKAPVTRIEIIPAQDPSAYSLLNSAPPFGYPGQFWVNKADSRKKAVKFNDALRLFGLQLSTTFNNEVIAGLRSKGYEVVVLQDVSRPEDDPDYVDYTKLTIKGDFLLHLWLSDIGVWSSYASVNYIPKVDGGVRLLRKGSDDYVVSEDLYYGVDADKNTQWTIRSDPKYAYRNFEILMASLEQVRGSFEEGTHLLAARVVDNVDRAIQVEHYNALQHERK